MCRKGEHGPKCEKILMASNNKKPRLFARLNPWLGGIFSTLCHGNYSKKTNVGST
jgi:hypothetical protein